MQQFYPRQNCHFREGREGYAIVSPFTVTHGAVKNTDYAQRHQKNHPTDAFRRLIVVVLVKLKHATILPAV